MNRHQTIVSRAALSVAVIAAMLSPAAAQTFQSYRCADGSRFILGLYQYDTRAYLQIDGGAVTLARRLTLSGSRYSSDGVTLNIGKSGTSVKRAHRPTTVCDPT